MSLTHFPLPRRGRVGDGGARPLGLASSLAWNPHTNPSPTGRGAIGSSHRSLVLAGNQSNSKTLGLNKQALVGSEYFCVDHSSGNQQVRIDVSDSGASKFRPFDECCDFGGIGDRRMVQKLELPSDIVVTRETTEQKLSVHERVQ